jgi:hypothetical protein
MLQPFEFLHVQRTTVEMDRKKKSNRPIARKEIAALRQVHSACRVDVGKNRDTPCPHYGERRGEGRKRGRQNLGPCPQAKATQPDLDCVKAVARPDGVGHSPGRSQLAFERFDFLPENIPSAGAYSADRADNRRFDELPLTFEVVLKYRLFGPLHASIYPATHNRVSIYYQSGSNPAAAFVFAIGNLARICSMAKRDE